MNLKPHWRGHTERRKKQINGLKGIYKLKTTTGWPRSSSIDRSMDEEFGSSSVQKKKRWSPYHDQAV